MKAKEMNTAELVATLHSCINSQKCPKDCPLYFDNHCLDPLLHTVADRLLEIDIKLALAQMRETTNTLQAVKLSKRVQELELENELLKDALKKTE